jgi:hypothetical protein
MLCLEAAAMSDREVQRQVATMVALMILGGLCIALVRGSLVETEQGIKNRHDVYFLPPPAQLKTLSLGYHAAMADVLWAHVLVSQGLHTFEKRRFENLTRLYDAINELDPTWQTPYLLAEALITFQTETTPYEEVVKVREILERGVQNRPFDAEIWLALGQWVAYVAPPTYLGDHPEVAARWRREGIEYLRRAAELGGAWQAMGGASILAREGDTNAALRFLRDAHAGTDDPEVKRDIEERIDRLVAHQRETEDTIAALEIQAYRARTAAFERILTERLPFVRADQGLVMGPPPMPAHCAGIGHHTADCATTWRLWSERFEREAQERARRDREVR